MRKTYAEAELEHIERRLLGELITKRAAAERIGMTVQDLEERIVELAVITVRRGRRTLIPVSEVERIERARARVMELLRLSLARMKPVRGPLGPLPTSIITTSAPRRAA